MCNQFDCVRFVIRRRILHGRICHGFVCLLLFLACHTYFRPMSERYLQHCWRWWWYKRVSQSASSRLNECANCISSIAADSVFSFFLHALFTSFTHACHILFSPANNVHLFRSADLNVVCCISFIMWRCWFMTWTRFTRFVFLHSGHFSVFCRFSFCVYVRCTQ